MNKKKILIVVGTRPNFIKVTQFKRLVESDYGLVLDLKIVHTGQHYDAKMADVFFEQFNLIPDFFLDIATDLSPNSQMATIMIELEKLLKNVFLPDLMLVVGDVNSTFAAAFTAYKLGIKTAHIESGLRSLDRSMPEEINRILTDEIVDYFFITEQSGFDNLIKEDKKPENLFFVGNTMIDTMVAFEGDIQSSDILKELHLETQNFGLMTIHRPSNVDTEDGLRQVLRLIDLASSHTFGYKIVFPIHPRTLKNAEKFGLKHHFLNNANLTLTDPLDYFGFQKLIARCQFIFTDSGGIQEESTFRQVPCFTFRPNTERPSTVEIGTNQLIPFDFDLIAHELNNIKQGTFKQGKIPPMWDGKATKRILETIVNQFLA